MWSDGSATLIPAVDKIVIPRSVIPRDNLLPGAEPIQLKDVCIVDQATLDQCLPPLEKGSYPLPCRKPDYVKPSEELRRFVSGLPLVLHKVEIVSPDRILDADIVPDAAESL